MSSRRSKCPGCKTPKSEDTIGFPGKHFPGEAKKQLVDHDDYDVQKKTESSGP